MRTPGSKANGNGRTAEGLLESMLMQRGLCPERQKRIGRTIFGGELLADLWLPPFAMFPDGLAIESKWQEAQGTVDEKLCYLVTNIRECYPCPAIVIIGGGGIRSGATAWLRRQVDGERLFAVFTWEEFAGWLMRTL